MYRNQAKTKNEQKQDMARDELTRQKVTLYIYVTECIVYMFRAIPFNLFFPVLFLFDWVGFLWPNYLRC